MNIERFELKKKKNGEECRCEGIVKSADIHHKWFQKIWPNEDTQKETSWLRISNQNKSSKALASTEKKKQKWNEIHVLCTPVHAIQPNAIIEQTVASETALETPMALGNRFSACMLISFLHPSCSVTNIIIYTICVYLLCYVCMRECVCECVICMVPKIFRRQQLGVIEYKIVAGYYINRSHARTHTHTYI